MRVALLTLLAALPLAAPLAQPAPAQAPARAKPVRVLVFDFTTQGEAAASLRRVLSDSAARELARIEGTQVLTQADIAAQLGADAARPTGSCADDRACMAEIAGSLDADRTLAGTVTQVGDSTIVAVTLVDARKMVTLGGAEESLQGARPQQLIEAARRLAYRAFTGKQLETTGAIEFDVPEAGARVLLDGEEIGVGPLKSTRRAAEGVHRVLVVKEGFATWETELRVAAGSTSSVVPRLAALPSAGARQPLGPWYAEFRLGLARPSNYETTGVEPCVDTFSSFCAGPIAVIRSGYRLNDSWAVEGGITAFTLVNNLTDPTNTSSGQTETKAIGLGAAGAWHPKGNRWFALAAEAGLFQATATADAGYQGPTESGESAKSWRAWVGAEGRVDYPFENVTLGLRAGVLLIAPGTGSSFTTTTGNVTVAVSGGAIVLPTVTAAVGYRF